MTKAELFSLALDEFNIKPVTEDELNSGNGQRKEIPVLEIYTAFIVCLVYLQPRFFRDKIIPSRGIFFTDGLEYLVTGRPCGFRVELQHVTVQFETAP